MGLQFERVAYASNASLTLIVNDLLRQTRDNTAPAAGTEIDMEDWINALSRQSSALISTSAGRANLEAWLAEVDQLTTP